MKSKIFRFLALTLVAAMLATTMFGCGEEKKEGGNKTVVSGVEIVEDDGSVASNIDTSKLRFGVTNTKKMPNYAKDIKNNTLKIITSTSVAHDDADIAAFKALTGIDIKLDYDVVNWGQIPERVASMVAAGNAPDYFTYSGTSWLNLVKQPYWDDLNTYIDFGDALWADTASINAGIGDFGGKRVGAFMPAFNYTNAIMYNTDLVEEAAEGNSELYDPLEMFYDGKWTWDALYSYVEEISDPSEGVYGISMPNTSVAILIGSTGEDIIKVSNDKTLAYNLESPNVTRALNFAKKIYKVSSGFATWEGHDMLLTNKCGFYAHINGVYALYATDASIAATRKGKLKAVPYPRDNKSDVYYLSGMSSPHIIPKNASNPWLAALWMYYKRYAQVNVSDAKKKYDKSVFMDDYGWTEDIYALTCPDYYPDKFAKVKYTFTPNCIAYGERMTDFDQATYWRMAVDTSVTTSSLIETVGPGLKEVISRFNATN